MLDRIKNNDTFRVPTLREVGAVAGSAVALGASAESASAAPVTVTKGNETYQRETTVRKTLGKDSVKAVVKVEVRNFDDTDDAETKTSEGSAEATVVTVHLGKPKTYAKSNAFKSKVRRAEKRALNAALNEARNYDDEQKGDTISLKEAALTDEQEKAIEAVIKERAGQKMNDGVATWEQDTFDQTVVIDDEPVAVHVYSIEDFKYIGAANIGSKWIGTTELIDPNTAYTEIKDYIKQKIGPAPTNPQV